MIYHIWPVRGSIWKWNLDQLKQRIDIFNGRRIVGIVHDSRSEPLESVKEYLSGHGCEFIVADNDDRGQSITFQAMMHEVASLNPNEVTFYAHAKGVKYEPIFPTALKNWVDALYRVTLDDWKMVWQQLECFAITGPFKMFGRFPAHRFLGDWHYSGAFFWMRNSDVFTRKWDDVQQFYFGVELWPGVIFSVDEGGCLFMEGINRNPYDFRFWLHEGNRLLESWQKKTILPIPPADLVQPLSFHGHKWPILEQKPDELEWFINLLLENKVHTLLTIGPKNGGVEWHVSRLYQKNDMKINITTIDLQAASELVETIQDINDRYGIPVRFIKGDSTSEAVRTQLNVHYDAVFIDGDHSYRVCRSDFILAMSLEPKLIGIHDIVDSDWHAASHCCVSRLWAEIVKNYRTDECRSEEWGGIGVVWPEEKHPDSYIRLNYPIGSPSKSESTSTDIYRSK